MIDKVTINLLPSGVPGLDEVLGGGLPEFSFNLIAGAPGCGKTTLAHQIMFALATPERPALYFTVLGEPPLKMLRYQQQFDFFDGRMINGSVRFISLSEDAAAGDLDRVLERIVAEVQAHKPALVFVDSFRSVMLASEAEGKSQANLQHFVQQLGVTMTNWQATTFLLGEYFSEADANPVFTVADGLIWLRQSMMRNTMVRKIEIMKMRGQPTLPGLHSFRITAAGVRVFAPAYTIGPPEDAAMDKEPLGPRLSMGVPGLDEMLCGGLPKGFSLLVAGPSGSGKSILAASFLAAGVERGETGVMVAFEQRPNRARSQVIAELIDKGKVSLVSTRVPNTSIDEIVQRVTDEIRRLKASRVVIDSLTGFQLVVAPTFQDDFRQSLLRLVTALAGANVTVMMTCELEDRYTDLRFSPFGTASLTDAIVVQRYIEVDSRLKRVMAVVKLRSSKHSNELRLFSIDDAGIQVGETLPDQEGLLGGRPTRKSQSQVAGPPSAAGHG